MKKITLKLINWIRNNPWEAFFLILVLAAGAFLRLYKIDRYMTFLGDEGRDAIVVRRFLTEFHPPLIGPGTSVGNMYLGPLYYYMMAPALLLANYSPVGPAVQVALLGVATIYFVWFTARKWFGKIAAITSSALYAISPTVIIFSKSSWNPNIMPFFALLSIYSIWKVWRENNFNWLIVLGISFAFVLQSHYLGLLLVPPLAVFWYLAQKGLKSKKKFLKKSLIGFVVFAVLMSPLLIFDIRHGWINTRAAIEFLADKKGIGFSLTNSVAKAGSLIFMIFSDLISARNVLMNYFVLAAAFIFTIWVFVSKKMKGTLLLIFLWLIFGILGLLLYKGPIYDHYLGFLFPAPFLLIAAVVENFKKNKILSIFLGIFFAGLLIVNILKSPILSNPGSQMQRAMAVAAVIKEKAGGERFNLATISNLNNRDVYEYFLIIWGTRIVDTDPSSLKYTVTDQLFVVCEFPREKCDPVHDPSAWITNFGWTKIVDEWPVWGGTLFRLGHTK